MRIITNNNISFAVLGKEEKITSTQDILDIIASAQYAYDCSGMIVYKESLGETFFDLKTGYAGEVLQKFSNYNMKIAILGDFSQYQSKSLHAFIYECNQGRNVFFKSGIEEGINALLLSYEER